MSRVRKKKTNGRVERFMDQNGMGFLSSNEENWKIVRPKLQSFRKNNLLFKTY